MMKPVRTDLVTPGLPHSSNIPILFILSTKQARQRSLLAQGLFWHRYLRKAKLVRDSARKFWHLLQRLNPKIGVSSELSLVLHTEQTLLTTEYYQKVHVSLGSGRSNEQVPVAAC